MQPIKLPNTDKSKELVTIAVAIGVIILVYIVVKHLSKIIGGIGTGIESAGEGIGTALGIVKSEDETKVNATYDKGSSPLFSYTFDTMKPQAPAGSPLITVAQAHDLIEKLKDTKSFFNFLDDTTKAIGIFSGLKTKFMVAWFAKRFLTETGRDLFEWLKTNYKSDIVADIIQNVNVKPVYK
jgi:hypothetical protein